MRKRSSSFLSHVTEEGDEEQLITAMNDGGDNNAGGVGVTQPNPNIMHNTTHNNNAKAQTSEVVPVEIAHLLASNCCKLCPATTPWHG